MDEKPGDRFSEIIIQSVRLRAQELLRQFFAAPESERPAIVEKMNTIWDEWLQMAPHQQELLDCFQRLVNRQGTVMPDFDALYKAKAELDRKLFEREE